MICSVLMEILWVLQASVVDLQSQVESLRRALADKPSFADLPAILSDVSFQAAYQTPEALAYAHTGIGHEEPPVIEVSPVLTLSWKYASL